MKVGKMRYRIMFLDNPQMVDDEGNITDTWNPVCTVWGDIVPVSGREFLGANQDMSEVTSKIYIRYRSDITPKMTATDGTHHYKLISVLGDRRSGMLTIMASEIT